jgi:hypothetical protein
MFADQLVDGEMHTVVTGGYNQALQSREAGDRHPLRGLQRQ